MAGDTSTSYYALPVKVGRRGQQPPTRHLFIKPHAAGADSLPRDRTLFVTGLPVAMDEGALLELFGRFGSVERAALHASKVSAVVLYEAASGRDAALAAAARGAVQAVELPEPSAPYGLKGGCCLRVPLAVLLAAWHPFFWYGGSELLPQGRCGRHLPPGRSAVGAGRGTGSSHPFDGWSAQEECGAVGWQRWGPLWVQVAAGIRQLSHTGATARSGRRF